MNISHTLRLLSLSAVALVALPALAEEDWPTAKVGALTFAYDEDSETCRVAPERTPEGESAYQGQVSVPPQVQIGGKTYQVIRIGDGAFTSYGARPNDKLTGVQLPPSIETIGQAAFQLCTALLQVQLPEGVDRIEAYAFAGCYALKMANIPASVTQIMGNPWNRCSALQQIMVAPGSQNFRAMNGVLYSADGKQLLLCPAAKTGDYAVPAGVNSIGMQAFYGCKSLTRIMLPGGLTTIGVQAFRECTALTKQSLPAGLTALGSQAFFGCSALESVTLPEGLQYLGTDDYATEGVFEGCTALAGINIPASVEHIDYAFLGYCTALKAITLSPGNKAYKLVDGALLTADDTQLVAYCPTSTGPYTIGKTVTEVGAKAFAGCPNVTEIAIQNPDVNLGLEAFAYCPKLTNITCSGSNFMSQQGVLLAADGDGKLLVCYPAGREPATYVVPAGVTGIDISAFKGSQVTSVTVPQGVENVEFHAFAYCPKLVTVSLPKSVTKVDDQAFAGSQALEEVVVPTDASAELLDALKLALPKTCKVSKK